MKIDSRLPDSIFIRLDSGQLQPTDLGRRVLRHAEKVELEMDQLDDSISRSASGLHGTIRITSVHGIVNKILVPALKPLLADNPNLNIELIPESRDLSLTQREADLAIRLARPNDGGFKVKARKLGMLPYATFVAASLSQTEAKALPWVTYEDSYSHLPQAKWLNKLSKKTQLSLSGLRVADSETALEAVAAGIGMAALPICIAKNETRLRPLKANYDIPAPEREVWLLSLGGQHDNRATKKVIDWIDAIRW